MIKNGLSLQIGWKSLLAAWYLYAVFLLPVFSVEWAAAQQGTGDESAPPWVRCLVFSPDGRLLAAAGADDTDRGELVVWKVGTWQPQWRHREPVGFPRAAFSPDGRLLALSRFAPETKLFDAASGELLGELQGHTNHARCVTFTPDGQRIITGSYDRTIKIWNASSGELEATLQGHTQPVYHVAVSSDGALLASAGARAGKAHLWDLTAQQPLHAFENLGSLVPHVSFSPDNRLLCASSLGGHLSLFDTESYQRCRRIGNIGGVDWAEFSPDQQWLAVVSGRTKVYVFSTDTKADAVTEEKIASLLAKFDEESYEVRERAMNDLAAIGAPADAQLREAIKSPSAEVRWRVRKLSQRLAGPESAVQLEGHTAELECVTFSPNGKLLVSGDKDGYVKVWRVEDWKEVVTLSIAPAQAATP